MNILGIDIGTTTITALIFDTHSGKVRDCRTYKNESFIFGKPYERLQNPAKILDTVKSAVTDITSDCTPDAIGVTGQMHGIVYLDKNFAPCSPLFTWQDERGNEIFKGNETYADYLTRITKHPTASGFGLATHFYNIQNNLVPENAVMLATIHDYIVSVLTNARPVTHSSDGASLGLFDLKNLCFAKSALSNAGIDDTFLPEVVCTTAQAGKTSCDFLPDGIPVAVAIGDNQSSFFGSVAEPESSVLVNVGTGSQVSFLTAKCDIPPCGEIRPLTDTDYIYVGSSLCGGRAYAVLKKFFCDCAEMLGGSPNDLYKKMDELSEGILGINDELYINCEFCGTRADPQKRGYIQNIGTENFTPQTLICGVLKGVSRELHDMYTNAADYLNFAPQSLVCSGNGLRKSKIWREIFEKDFSLTALLPRHSEEAAIGACVFAGASCGIFEDIKASRDAILR